MTEPPIEIKADNGGDGYCLYDALKDGAPQLIAYRGQTYTMQFCGSPYGADNYLLVEAEDGTQKRWGWGWNQDVCFKCLRDLRDGWEMQESYEPYRVKITTKEE